MSASICPLLSWYESHARTLPWRILPAQSRKGEIPVPYRVWLSEIMLQQTTVKAVIPYFEKFTKKWPTLHALAQANPEEIFEQWAGLGYYTRAKNLIACSKIISERQNGFPRDVQSLKQLPGIGDYTAAAIAAIAFNIPDAIAVDANIRRIVSRLYGFANPSHAMIRETSRNIIHNHCIGDHTQALMDLGSLVCTSRLPSCRTCPLMNTCTAYKTDNILAFPAPALKKRKKNVFGTFFFVINDSNEVLIITRPDTGMLSGMLSLPSTQWDKIKSDKTISETSTIDHPFLNLQHLTQSLSIHIIPEKFHHEFTHLSLCGTVWLIRCIDKTDYQTNAVSFRWVSLSKISDLGLPSVMRKAVHIGLHFLEKTITCH